MKPLLNVARQEEEMKAKEEELRDAMSKTQAMVDRIKELEEKLATLSQEKNDLTIQLQAVSLLNSSLRKDAQLPLA